MSFVSCRSSSSSTSSCCRARCGVCTYCRLLNILETIDDAEPECVTSNLRCYGVWKEQLAREEIVIKIEDLDENLTGLAPTAPTLSMMEMRATSLPMQTPTPTPIPWRAPLSSVIERVRPMLSMKNIYARILIGLIVLTIFCVMFRDRCTTTPSVNPTVMDVIGATAPKLSSPVSSDPDGIWNRL